MADEKEKKEAAASPAEGGKSGGGLLPLIIAVVAMPALAYTTTSFILLPKLQAAIGAQADGETHGENEPKDDGHEADAHGGGHGGGHGDSHGGGHGSSGGGSGGNMFDLGKVLVNPKGSAGTRYLVAKYTLKGKTSDFESKMESSKPQLLDIASSVMASRSLVDLEQPGARNLIRNELLTSFNNALGGAVVKEIYITEFAIQ